MLAAVTAMKQLFAAEGLSFHDIATVIESCNGEIEERKYSDTDAEDHLRHAGSKKAASKKRSAAICRRNFTTPTGSRAGTRSRFFAGRISRSCAASGNAHSSTTWPARRCGSSRAEKQAKHLLGIFIRLGGVYEPNN